MTSDLKSGIITDPSTGPAPTLADDVAVPHVVATLAHPRSPWPTTLARWVTSGAAPVELVTCLSAEELSVVIASGRRLSAVLLDGANSRVRPELVADLRDHTVPIGVDAPGSVTDWDGLGVSTVLGAHFERGDLMALLERSDAGARGVDQRPSTTLTMVQRRASVVAVCGSGGAGSSVVSMAIAQGLADGARRSQSVDQPREVLLIDGSRRAHQALYHHTGDVLPGLMDLVARNHRRPLDGADLDELTHETDRGYDLLLGAPTPRDAAALGPADLGSVLEIAVNHNDVVVVDHEGDLPLGHLSNALAGLADVWVIVTGAGIKGLHDALRFAQEAKRSAVAPERVLVACNRVRRRDPARVRFPIELSRMAASMGLDLPAGVVLPEVRLEAVHHDATPVPRRLVQPIAARVGRLLDHAARHDPTAHRHLAGATIRTAAP